MNLTALNNSERARLLSTTAFNAHRFKILRAIWPVVFLSLTFPVGNARAVEYDFRAPDGPLIWDFSGTYSSPLMTLQQSPAGFLVNNVGGQGSASGKGSSIGLTLVTTRPPRAWIAFTSTHIEILEQDSCTTTLTLNPSLRILVGDNSCITVGQDYVWFLGTWNPVVNGYGVPTLTTRCVSTAVSLPLPNGVDGHWRLALDVVPNGSQLSGQACITLASSNVVQLQVIGTNATVNKSVMKLQTWPNDLTVVTTGSEMSLQSIHGNVAGQSVDYDSPARTSLLSLNVNGSGNVTPLRNGQALALGKDYTLNAAPRPGNLFSNWSVAGIPVTNPTLRFTMCSNLVITANFVTNPFTPASGVYNGLFYETNGVRQPGAGCFTVTLVTSGAFSGNVLLAGGTHSFSGRFDAGGRSQIQVRRGSKPALTVGLELNFEAPEIHGTVSDGTWTAELFADRAYSKSAINYLGVYTMVIPGNDAATDFLGDSFASVWIDFYGTIHLTGTLADGTRISRSVKISRNGRWPLYVPLYGHQGSLLSWICFSNQPASSLGGDLIWFKPAHSTGKLFPVGFTNQTSAIGSSFLGPGPSNGRLQLSFTNGLLILDGGNLPVALTNTFYGNGTATGTNRINLKWNVINGRVSGSFVHPATGRSTPLQGVLLQNQNLARGFFLGTNRPAHSSFLNDPK